MKARNLLRKQVGLCVCVCETGFLDFPVCLAGIEI